jgi:hypothetical protein
VCYRGLRMTSRRYKSVPVRIPPAQDGRWPPSRSGGREQCFLKRSGGHKSLGPPKQANPGPPSSDGSSEEGRGGKERGCGFQAPQLRGTRTACGCVPKMARAFAAMFLRRGHVACGTAALAQERSTRPLPPATANDRETELRRGERKRAAESRRGRAGEVVARRAPRPMGTRRPPRSWGPPQRRDQIPEATS